MPNIDSLVILLVLATLLSAAFLAVMMLVRRQQHRVRELERRIADRDDRSAAEAAELPAACDVPAVPDGPVADAVPAAKVPDRPAHPLDRWVGFAERHRRSDSADVVRRAAVALGAGERNRYLALECRSHGVIADYAGQTDFAQILVDAAALLEPTHADRSHKCR